MILTHDLIRVGENRIWKCVNCNKEGQTIGEVNSTECPSRPKTNENVIHAISQEGKFK